DTAGNCGVTGVFQVSADFGPTTLASSGGADIFIARLGTEVAVEDETTPPAEGQSRLYAAWPNPSGKNRLINLKARVAAGETGTLSIYNLRGELIGRQDLTAGEHQIDLDGRSLPAGMYVYRLRTSTVNTVKKLIIR
ncbi:MAG: T9SS type A sorting domain-containing protein, partial [Candidatus Cloacimonetes bacterium]|nr:T9SS type A sorting domain-containing protein [Candidatus Cloacimonadota bacterium]